MNTSKIIKGVVGGGRYTVTAPIIKEDYGLYLQIEGIELPDTYEVDFSNDEHSGTSVTMIGNADGVLIPNQFIKSGKDVFAFLYHVGEDYGRTVYKFRIPNKLRPDRTNEEPTPEEQSTIDQTISALNDAVESAQDAQQAIEDMSVSATTLAEGSFATVTKTESEGVVHLEFGIPTGATGAKGDKGDKGEKGDRGEQGIQGAQGERGLTGQDGISPTVSITPITGGHRITITDADGEHSADVMDGTGSVDDVQINGQSIVENGVANVPVASTETLGAVKTSILYGTGSASGQLRLQKATDSEVKNGNGQFKPITPYNQHAATFYGLAKAAGDTTQSQSSNAVGEYTEEAKSAIRTMLGIGGGGSMWKDKKVCVFGDSIGYGYNNNAHSFVDILSERGFFASVHKNCVSGSTTATWTARLQESADEVAEADIVYAEYEANDIVGLKAGTLTTDALVSTVRNCTSAIRNVNPTCTIIWLPLTIQHLDKLGTADGSYYRSWVNAMYPVFSELGINMLPIFDTLNANHASSDGRHPNDAGHEAIADLIMQMPLGTSNYPTALMTEWTGGAY